MKVPLEIYETILDALKVGITVIDAQSNIIVMNRLFGEMVEKNPKDLIGSSVLLCHPAESRPAVQKMISEFREGTRTHYENWLNFRGKILHEQIYPILSDQNTFQGVIDMLIDGTEKANYMKRLGEWQELPLKGAKT